MKLTSPIITLVSFIALVTAQLVLPRTPELIGTYEDGKLKWVVHVYSAFGPFQGFSYYELGRDLTYAETANREQYNESPANFTIDSVWLEGPGNWCSTVSGELAHDFNLVSNDNFTTDFDIVYAAIPNAGPCWYYSYGKLTLTVFDNSTGMTAGRVFRFITVIEVPTESNTTFQCNNSSLPH